jgi:hypothetical protein
MSGLAAVTLAQGGNRESSRRLWQEMLKDQDAADWIMSQARFRLTQLDALDQIDALERVVNAYAQRSGSLPRTWEDVVRAGYLRGIPVDPERHPYQLDSSRGRVELDPRSPLNPLPTSDPPRPAVTLGAGR